MHRIARDTEPLRLLTSLSPLRRCVCAGCRYSTKFGLAIKASDGRWFTYVSEKDWWWGRRTSWCQPLSVSTRPCNTPVTALQPVTTGACDL